MFQLRREYAALKRELLPPVAKLSRPDLEERITQLRRVKEQLSKPAPVVTTASGGVLTFG
jgi:hypothetical protein